MTNHARVRQVIARRLALRSRRTITEQLTDEWFPEERAFFDDPAQLTAACCGRRAGKTRGLVRDHLRDVLTVPGYRGLYLNSTRGEAERLAWIGNRGDGFQPLVENLKLPLKLDGSDLTIYNPATEGWMYLRGADDEPELRKALGGAYHKVTWDEAQKIPPKLGQSIREVFFPALLDFGGRFRMTGTPSRSRSGLFFDVTRPDIKHRLKGWSVHHWTLLHNTFFGATHDERWTRGVLGLQQLYGGSEVAPIDSPLMQREAFGRWVPEETSYVYAVHRVPQDQLLYAPHRRREDGFVDIPKALGDLPWDWREGMFSMGVDIGFHPDPFAIVLWGWSGRDPALYEVASWKKTHLTSDEQNAAMKAVRENVAIGIIPADAGGPAKPTVRGWSKEWVERYGLPIVEAEKQHKHTAIDVMNTDILKGNLKLRDGSPLYDEMSVLQWSTVVSATGKLIEDPTMDNHCCDGGLYAHRHSYQFRWRPEDVRPEPGTPEAIRREEQELEDDIEEAMDDGYYH